MASLSAAVKSQTGTLGDSDCEALRSGLLAQPVNAVSSLGYVAAGAWFSTRITSLPRSQRPAAGAYGAALVLSGLGSVAYHGPQFSGAQWLHDLPIVALVALGAGVPLVRAVRSCSAVPGADRSKLSALGAIVALSLGSYVLGRTGGPLCRPDSPLQLHGLWHIGTASAATLWATMLWPRTTSQREPGDA
ncbi:MAG: hypothetical protein ACK5O2_03890 [Microthrixaceae bacterium]